MVAKQPKFKLIWLLRKSVIEREFKKFRDEYVGSLAHPIKNASPDLLGGGRGRGEDKQACEDPKSQTEVVSWWTLIIEWTWALGISLLESVEYFV